MAITYSVLKIEKKLKPSTETLKCEEKVLLNRQFNLFLEDTFIEGTKCSVWLIFRKSVSCLVKGTVY